MANITVKNLGLIDYQKAWDMQKELFNKLLDAKKRGEECDLYLLLLEHPHVYTMGLHGNMNNLLFNDEFLERIGAQFFKIERGGDVTYHGYGQLVGYPIFDLEQLNMGIKEYIWTLEEAIIMTINEYGIIGERMKGAVGVWIGSKTPNARKISAIGVKASRYITMHGFALNVTTDLQYFNHINPCGFTDKSVTSIEKETNLKPSLDQVGEKFVKNLMKLIIN
jgi:lipoyl(octanoyl) transferase